MTQYAIPSLQPGMTFQGIIPATNTGPATLAPTGFGTAPGAKPIFRKDGLPVQAGDLPGGAIVSWRYDGTGYRITSMVASDIVAASAPVGRSQVFIGTNTTTQSTFTVPPGVTSLEVWLVAGGGGGGASGYGNSGSLAGNPGGGGGGGALGYRRLTGLVPGSAITVTMGAFGVGVAGAPGTAAATSSFGSYLSCTGGGAGSWGDNTYSAGLAGGTVSGLVAANGDWGVPGGTGGTSGSNSNTPTISDAYRIYARGGQAAMFGIVDLSLTGSAGKGYGPGGTGASGGSGLAGGNGAPSLCIVRW